jgi:hypothetical protein
MQTNYVFISIIIFAIFKTFHSLNFGSDGKIILNHHFLINLFKNLLLIKIDLYVYNYKVLLNKINEL